MQKFLRDLDHFSVWLTRTQTAVANSDSPQSLAEAEQMLNQHQTIKEEIDRYAPDYSKLKDSGDKVCNNADASDPQYLFLRERLNAHEQGMYSLFINVFNFKFYILKILLTKKENDLAMYLAR